METSAIKSHYCQTQWGPVCYWLNTSLPAEPPLSPDKATIKLVLFLHGVGGSGRYWSSYLEELAQESERVIALAPDLLGFGASAKPNIDYTSEVHLKVIEAVLNDYLGDHYPGEAVPVDFYLVGHSMGGILALLLAARLVSGDTKFNNSYTFRLAKLVLLGTPYASPTHDLKQEVLGSPMNRAMLSRPLICETVHYSLKLLWPLVIYLIKRGFIKVELPLPVIVDYMQHTCQSYTSSAHRVIFETNLDPALKLLQESSSELLQVLLIYSRSDEEVSWKHGQELSTWFKSGRLEVLERISHQGLGQAALNKVVAFFLADLTKFTPTNHL